MDHPEFICAYLCLLTIFQFSLAVNLLSPNQTLADGNVLISPGKMFELGFFSPGKSTARFLGIRYKATPDLVVWVANRNNPITDSTGVLTLTRNGTLILSTTLGDNIWSSDSSTPASNPALRLLDTGNLVVTDISSNTWQSFDYPTDTRLPGMKIVQDPDNGISRYLTSWKNADDPSVGRFSCRIENQGLSQMVILDETSKINRQVFWNGYFTGPQLVKDQTWSIEVESRSGRLISLSNPFIDSNRTRLTMNQSGLIEGYMMNEDADGWNFVVALPRDMCGKYSWCGSNSICNLSKAPECECLRGFTPKSMKEWGMLEWKNGCYRNQSLDCQKEDGFLRVERIKLPDSVDYQLNTSMNIERCRLECLKNCNCSAYTDPYSANGTSCMMWFGDLIDIRDLSMNQDGRAHPSVYFRLPLSQLDWQGKKKGVAKIKLILIAAGSCFGMLLILGLSFDKWIRNRQAYRKTREEEEFELPMFDLATIAAATNNFSIQNQVGKGGFGPVYKGNLPSGEVIAVKRMSRTSGQGTDEFKNEVTLIAKLQHRNLVRLLGCCSTGEEKMLIYEYMPNKSLDYFIFDENRSAELSWPKRFEIIMGIVRGLHYLHHDSRLKIIHRDLKTSNVLLDEKLNAKISDFGLARMFRGDQTTERTARVVGTYGYMAPEYAFDGNFSLKSDVYSMGVMILEIVSGRKNRGSHHPSDYSTLLEQAWQLWNEGKEMELMDPCYNDSCVESQVKRCIQVGLLCVQNKANERPFMSSVLLMLNTDDMGLPQPQGPGFFLQITSDASENKNFSKGTVTMSDLLPR